MKIRLMIYPGGNNEFRQQYEKYHSFLYIRKKVSQINKFEHLKLQYNLFSGKKITIISI